MLVKNASSFTKVHSKVDFIELEHEMLGKWQKEKTFDKLREKNKNGDRWSFLDGPITANNPMGVHHAWGRSLKDIYQRYHAMLGHQLRYQNGFDCQGLWVEVEVEKELGFKSKREIEEYGIEKFVNLCKDRVRKYSKIQTDQSIRLGYWMDWENSYFTMSDENNYTIWSFLKKLFDENKIYKGVDVVPWSGRSGTSYSQMEIIEGRKLVTHKAIFVKFPIKSKPNENLLVWTTTPWTLTANSMAAINPGLNYLKVKAKDGSIYYFAEDNFKYQRLEKQFKEKKQWIKGVPKLKTLEQIFKERGGYEILDTLPGKELIGWEYEGPFDHFEVQKEPGGYPFTNIELAEKNITAIDCHKVIDPGKDNYGNDIVVAGEGTGIVHMAPGCGDIDHRIGKKLNYINIAPLNEESKFIEKFENLSGKCATDQNTIDEIIQDLKDRNLLVHVEEYPHVYPHCWRSGDELVFRMVDEWYINMDWRDKIKKIVDDIRWIPAWGSDREHEWLENMSDWMISKKRFWGLALPVWEFEDGSFWVVGSKEELRELAVEGWEEFKDKSPHKPWIDKVKIKHPKTGLTGTRIKDVGNPWLDAGIVPFSTLNYNSDKEYWKKWFPADFIVECFPGQFRNWFYSLLAMSAMMEEKAPFKTLLGHALVKDEQGREMHKSWGNAIWFDDAVEKMGADVMRWIYASQKTEHNLNFGYGIADEERKHLITLWNTYSFFITYARLDGFEPFKQKLSLSQRTKLDRWILAKTNLLVLNTKNHFEQFEIFKLMNEIKIYIDDLSNWYVRRNRRRFWKSENDADKTAAYDTLYLVLTTFIRLLAPIAPFLTEKIYKNLVADINPEMPESVHLADFPEFDESLHDEELLNEISLLKEVISLGRSARNKANIKNRQPLSELAVHCKNDVESVLKINEDQILEELNLKSLTFINDEGELISYNLKPDFQTIGQKYGDLKGLVIGEINKQKETLLPDVKSRKPITISCNNEKITLDPSNFILEESGVGDFEVSTGQNCVIGINTKLTPKLINEGIVRDLVRHVQNLRKESGLNVEDRISFGLCAKPEIHSALEENKEYFLNEILGKDIIVENSNLKFRKIIKINGESVELAISLTS